MGKTFAFQTGKQLKNKHAQTPLDVKLARFAQTYIWAPTFLSSDLYVDFQLLQVKSTISLLTHGQNNNLSINSLMIPCSIKWCAYRKKWTIKNIFKQSLSNPHYNLVKHIAKHLSQKSLSLWLSKAQHFAPMGHYNYPIIHSKPEG